MSIIAQSVGGAYAPVTQVSVTGTSVQPITGAILVVGGQVLNGRPFNITAQGYIKAHGATQTVAIGYAGQVYSTTPFTTGTQLGTGTASGVLTAGTYYPWLLEATCFADNTSGVLSGNYSVCDGSTPVYKIQTVNAALLTGVTFGSNNVGTNVTNPLAAAQAPALQFAVTFTNSVADTTEKVTITSFYATSD